MKLNREQIVKALEEWIKRYKSNYYREHAVNALALIRELTKDVERVSKQCGEIIDECDERDAERLMQVAKLTEENERLRVVADMSDTTLTDALRIVKKFCDSRIKRAKANTVRKMQEEARQMCFIIGDEEYVTLCDLDKIAKELLEEVSDG